VAGEVPGPVGEPDGPDWGDNGVVVHPAMRRKKTIKDTSKKKICFIYWNTLKYALKFLFDFSDYGIIIELTPNKNFFLKKTP
jgi:hypothetical protein